MKLRLLKRKRLFDAVWWALLLPVFLLLKLIPRDRRRVVFGSSQGWHFADNAKYLFLYASDRVKGVEAVFISKDPEVVRSIRQNGLQAASLYSVRGLAAVMRAGRAFVSHSTEDIHPVFLSGAEVVQLWHGTPIRKIVHDSDWNRLDPKKFSRNHRFKVSLLRLIWQIFPYTHGQDRFNRIAVSSEAVVPSFCTAFRMSADKAVVVGQPRNDCLLGAVDFDRRFFPETAELEKLRRETGVIVSWLPTHRAQAGGGIVDFLNGYGFDAEALKQLCDKHNMRLVIKPHYLVKDEVERRLAGDKRFVVYEHVDPYPLLQRTDVLITDYSSVYLDFLLLNRPIVFAPFDYEDYLKYNADLYYDFDDITPGPKCRNWPAVISELDRAAAALAGNGTDEWKERRLEIGERFNRFQGGFCKRAVNEFLK